MESNLKIVYVYMTESLCCTLEIYVCVCAPSRVPLFVTSWTVTHQASLSTEFSRQEN